MRALRGSAGLAGPDRLQPRADPLPLRRGARVARRRAGGRDDAVAGCRRAGRDRGGGRPRGALRELDRQAARGAGRGQPGGGAHFNFTFPEPSGVVGVIAPDEPDVLGLVAEIRRRWRRRRGGGGGVRALAAAPLHLGEVLGVADMPAGVVNLLSGLRSEREAARRPPRRRAAIVDPAGDPEVTRLAADSVTRVSRGSGRRLRRRAARRAVADRAVRRAQDRLAPGGHLKPGPRGSRPGSARRPVSSRAAVEPRHAGGHADAAEHVPEQVRSSR